MGLIIGILVSALFANASPPLPITETVEDVYITILSDMVISDGFPSATLRGTTRGEWGFAALIEVKTGGTWKKILFDSGGAPQTVLYNIKKMKDRAGKLGINLCDVEDVVLSHNHTDHTSGFVEIRKDCLRKDSKSRALINAYVGSDEIFWPRLNDDGSDDNLMAGYQKEFTASGGRFVRPSDDTSALAIAGIPGVWATGKIQRFFDEKTYPKTPLMTDPSTGKKVVDTVPEDQALVINTAKGLIVVTGCSHAGVVNTLTYSSQLFGGRKILALLGGFHLIGKKHGDVKKVGTMDWTAANLKPFDIKNLLGAHCSGLRPLQYFQKILGLDDQHAMTSTIDSRFTLEKGLIPTDLNHAIADDEG